MSNTLGKRIATHRKRLGLTQEQLAEKLGLTAQAVSKWENDQSCPDITVLPVLADIFQITTDELLGHHKLPAAQDTINNESESIENNPESSDSAEDSKNIHVSFNLDKSDSLQIKGKLLLIGTAAWFLTVGILYLLAKLLHWDCSLWDILWPSALLVYGIFGMISKISLFWLACSAVGAFFLTTNIFPLPFEPEKGILWAVIIIICGVMLLLDALRKKHNKTDHNIPKHEYNVSGGDLYCVNSFGQQEQLVMAEKLEKAKISNSFGEYTVDLSGVDAITENCTISASCSFGELTILVPKRFAVHNTSSKVFADFSVCGAPDTHPEGQISLHASVHFGEIVVKYI